MPVNAGIQKINA